MRQRCGWLLVGHSDRPTAEGCSAVLSARSSVGFGQADKMVVLQPGALVGGGNMIARVSVQ